MEEAELAVRGNAAKKFYGEESMVWNCMTDDKIYLKFMCQL